MFHSTFAANAPFNKQRRYPKVRRREPDTGESNSLRTDRAASFSNYGSHYKDNDVDLEDESYWENHEESNKDATKLHLPAGSQQRRASSGAEYIRKLIEEANDTSDDHEVNKQACDSSGMQRRSSDSKVVSKITHTTDAKHRVLLKEKPILRSLSVSKGAKLSKSNIDLSSSFLSNALHDALFAVHFTVPEAEKHASSTSLNTKSGDRIAPIPSSKVKESNESTALKKKSTGRKTLTKTPVQKGHLTKSLKSTVFQPKLLVQANSNLTSSCPDLSKTGQQNSHTLGSLILKEAIRSSNFLFSIPGTHISDSQNEVDSKSSKCSRSWEKIEIIDQPDITPEVSLPIPSIFVIDDSSESDVTSKLNESTTKGDENRSQQESSSGMASDERCLNEYSPSEDEDMHFSLTELRRQLDVSFASNSADNPFSSSSSDIDAWSLQSSRISTGAELSDEDRTKSIKDVLSVLNSIQGDTEIEFFEDRCCAAGPGLTEGFVDQPTMFHVVLMDKPDLDNLRVLIEGPGILQPRTEFVPLTKNIIRVVYWPERVGEYTVRVFWKNRAIPGSPFRPLILLPKCEVWVKRVL